MVRVMAVGLFCPSIRVIAAAFFCGCRGELAEFLCQGRRRVCI